MAVAVSRLDQREFRLYSGEVRKLGMFLTHVSDARSPQGGSSYVLPGNPDC